MGERTYQGHPWIWDLVSSLSSRCMGNRIMEIEGQNNKTGFIKFIPFDESLHQKLFFEYLNQYLWRLWKNTRWDYWMDPNDRWRKTTSDEKIVRNSNYLFKLMWIYRMWWGNLNEFCFILHRNKFTIFVISIHFTIL